MTVFLLLWRKGRKHLGGGGGHAHNHLNKVTLFFFLYTTEERGLLGRVVFWLRYGSSSSSTTSVRAHRLRERHSLCTGLGVLCPEKCSSVPVHKYCIGFSYFCITVECHISLGFLGEDLPKRRSSIAPHAFYICF